MKKILLSICLSILSVPILGEGTILLDKVMAIVNKEVITWSELYKTMEFEATEAIKSMKEEDRRRFFKDNEMAYLENLIDMRLQIQEAVKAGIGAGESDVDKAVESMRTKHSMTDQQFREAIQKEGFSMPEYRRKLSEQITIGRIVEQEVRGKVLVTEGEVTRYLSEHAELERESEGFSISHILLRKKGDRGQIEEKAREIEGRIKTGEDFSALAREFSEDSSAKTGGALGFVRKSDLSRDFLAALSKMKPGDVSEPFWTENGIHILRLDEIHAVKNPQELREKVRQKLLDERFTREYRNWIKGLREKAYIDIKA